MRKVVLSLVLLSGVFADGFFYSAHAQCAPEDKIYIDPRLVPKRLDLTAEQLNTLMHSQVSPEVRNALIGQYTQKYQPIVVPYGTGKVLVSPTNPCIQQYIP